MNNDYEDGPPEEAQRGLFASLRAMLDRALALIHTRGDLVATELEEEVARLVGVLVWSFAGVACAVVGAAFLGAMVLIAAPPGWRTALAAVIGALFLVVALVAWLTIRRIAGAKPRPFDASLAEFEKDRRQLRGER